MNTQRIHLVAPASGVPPERFLLLEQALASYSVFIPEQLLTPGSMFHASSDEHRFKQLVASIDDASSSVIWALRGGYGSARLLERLSALPKPLEKKVVIGCSDITALHLFFSRHWQWRTIHGAGLGEVIEEKPRDPANISRVLALLNHQVSQQQFSHLQPMNRLARTTLKVEGALQGGNLTLVESSLATFWQVQTQGTILLLEDIGEKGYRIDRSLLHLKQAGLFSEVNAVVFGEFLGDDSSGIAYALQRFADEIDIPVYQTQQFGHGKINYPFIYGARAQLELKTTGKAVLTMYVD